MEALTELLAYPFMRHALYAALLASLACGIVGTLVVFNRMVFLAGGASHAAYGGIGLSLYFGLPMLPCTLAFTLAASLLMAMVSARQPHSELGQETSIGVLWAAGMAFGIILVELSPGYAGELMGFLFGSILAVPQSDLALMTGFNVLLLAFVYLFRHGLWAISIDSEFARARGIAVGALHLALVAASAVTIVMLIRIVGLILVLALLTIPPSIARRFCRGLYSTMMLAVGLCLLFCLCGLTFSWFTNISSGASIIMVATLCYFLSLGRSPKLRR